MLEQYFGMKARHPDALLLMRVGDFYEAYGDEAERLARALQIALTSKEAGGGKRIAMAGVPYHALSHYLAKLVRARIVVAIAEQMEEPRPNKLVRRDVVRVVTPGTLLEDQLLDGKENNFLAAVSAVGGALAIAHADVSTGYCAATAFTGEHAASELAGELERIAPSEVVADVPPHVRAIVADVCDRRGARVTVAPLATVGERERPAIEDFSADESLAIHRALDVLQDFVRRTVGLAGDGVPGWALVPSCYRRRAFLVLDQQTCKHLELTAAQGQRTDATLFTTLDTCMTAMGSRLLARWITAPLVDVRAIEERLDAVEALASAHGVRATLRDALGACFDLERIAQKVRFRKASPRDLASLRRTLHAMTPVRAAAPPVLAARASRLDGFEGMVADLERVLADDPPVHLSDGGVIRPDADPELAECIAMKSDARRRLAELEERERARTGIKSLKIKYTGPFGYAIEVGKAAAGSVPPDYTRKQTLATGERFTTPELKELESAIVGAQARAQHLEERLYAELLERIAVRTDDLLRAAEALAEIDVLSALAQCAAERGYVRPRFVERSIVEIEEGRHPVMETILRTRFVPNDVRLRDDTHRFILLTGPNMGGKSTYLRQTGLLVIMAQMGSFVPAAAMTLGPVDRIFTRIGAGDDLASGQSTFFMEMAEAANILRESTRRSLLLIDEVGRGTGTIDGLAIAQAICEHLLASGERCPMTLFATHFHELCALADHWPLVANYHITAVENTARDGAPVFSHRVQPGSTSRSFGIEVARMAGLPPRVIERAREIAEALSGKADVEAHVPLRRRAAPARTAEPQLPLLPLDLAGR
jgi:DNA mismatch repair protein MutS